MEGNQEFRQITLDEWLYWKEDIRDKLRETAGNFVYIGYRLKQIRDSGMYDGAADIFEFARKEYGLGKSTVSRFIAINEKFSEGGNSLELRAEYRGIGSSKLSDMLTLPDAECSLITERTTVKEIRELKRFLRQQPPEGQEAEIPEGPGRVPGGTVTESVTESAGTGTESAETGTECTEATTKSVKAAAESMEPVPGNAGSGGGRHETGKEQECSGRTREAAAAGKDTAGLTPLGKCLAEYFRDKKELLNDVMALVHGGRFKAAAERMNPSGYGTYRKGLVFLFMYDFPQGVKYKVFGHPEISELDWETFLDRIYAIYADLYESGADDVHGAYYREPEQEPVRKPEKEPGHAEEAPSPGQEGMPAAEDGNAGENGKGQELLPAVATSQQEEGKAEAQLPGQMEVGDFPELLPESSVEVTEDVSEEGLSGPETAGAAVIPRVEEPDTAAGMPELVESAGNGSMPAGTESVEDVRMEADGCLERLRKTFTIWDGEIPLSFLVKAHQDTIDLAAAIEKLMDIRKRVIEGSGRF